MFNNKNKAIIFLKSNGFYLFSSASNNILNCQLSPDLLNDYEVLNREKLQLQINSFLKTNKITSSDVIVILPETVYFDKDIFEKDEVKKKAEIQSFIDSVPIEYVRSGIIKLEKGEKFIAINQELYDTVKDSFEDHGSAVIAAIPYFILQQFGVNPLLDFDLNAARSALRNFDRLQRHNIFNNQVARPEEKHFGQSERTNGSSHRKISKNFLYLSAVFGVLLIVLVVMLISSSTPPAKTPVKASVPPPTSAVLPQPTTSAPVVPTVNTPATQAARTESILIRNSSGDPQKATSFRNRLNAIGFEEVELDSTPLATSSTTLVVFAQSVPTATRDLIFDEIRALFSNVSLGQGTETEADILINLGKPL